MKNICSFIACCVISVVLFQYRFSYSHPENPSELKLTTWDALGYYMYLPGIFIYDDVTQLNWFPAIDKKYDLSGGQLYQAHKLDNDNYVLKYLGGVAIVEAPFFFIGHLIAKNYGYEADGFSPPYQYSIGFGILLYCILAIFLLRKILLLYFSDLTTAVTLLLLILASNIVQYICVDTAMSHAPIFPIYVLVLYTTLKWHEQPKIIWAALTGYVIGLAMISRPTEAIMLFIPLFWNAHTKELTKEKWKMVKENKKHILFSLVFVFIGVLPQLIYWKIATGSFVYDVGSKWFFLNPFFRVLFGWENGWFIYTPITIFFIIGCFFMKSYSFRKSVIWFCVLNIWIIISWSDWRYGATYSTRALTQSYAVLALPLAAFIEQIKSSKWRIAFYVLGAYLIFVNLFQIKQYNQTVLHYRDMNRKYYARIYLNPHPTPLDVSLMDTEEFIYDETGYQKNILIETDSVVHIKTPTDSLYYFLETSIESNSQNETWVKIESAIKISDGYQIAYLCSELQVGDSVKHNRIRLFSPIGAIGEQNNYAFYVHVSDYFHHSKLRLYINSQGNFEGEIDSVKITCLKK